jgi:hypothetical protein
MELISQSKLLQDLPRLPRRVDYKQSAWDVEVRAAYVLLFL